MSDRDRFDEDFEGLDRHEAESLDAITKRLRDEPLPEQDDAFWATLKQRVMNEVDVTPLQKPKQGSLWELIRHGTRPLASISGRRAFATALVLALAVIGLLVFPRQPVDQSTAEVASPLLIPDELWVDGFFAVGTPTLEAVEQYGWLDEVEGGLIAEPFDDLSYGEDFGWELESLTLEELMALEQMLDG